jgi:hypothetical protein
VILKPLLKGIHESHLTHFGVVGLIAEGNLPDLSRRAIQGIAFNWPTGWATFRRGRVFCSKSGLSGGLGCYRSIFVDPRRQSRTYFLNLLWTVRAICPVSDYASSDHQH